jgi:two-component system repressor protein LuxO
VIEIAEHMLAAAALEEGKSFTQLSDEVKSVFRTYGWPGNVRQLRNVIRNVVVMNESDTVKVDMLPPPLDRIAVPRAFKAVG